MTTTFRLMASTCLALLAGAAMADTEIRFTHAETAGGTAEALNTIIAAFEAANPGITVRQITFDDDIYQDTGMITQLQSNEVPDIYFQWPGYGLARDVKAGYARDISDAMAGGWSDSFIETAFAPGAGTVIDDKIYMVPLSVDVTNTLWYNVKIFREQGLAEPKTWEEFIAAIKVLAAAGETPIVTGNNELWPLGNWASHIAGRTVSAEDFAAAFSQQKTFAEAGFLRPLQLMQELHEAGAFNRDMQSLGADPAMATFFQEAAVMHPIGSWLVSSAPDLAEEGFEYGDFDTPLIDANNAAPHSAIGTMTGLVVHAKAQHPDEAIAFLKFLSTPEMQKVWAEGGSISPVKGVSELIEADPHYEAMAQLLADADGLVPPPDTAYPVPVAEAWYQAAAYAASGEKTAQEALDWLDTTVKAMGPQ